MIDKGVTRETVESWIKAYGVACVLANSLSKQGEREQAHEHTEEARRVEHLILDAIAPPPASNDDALSNIEWALDQLKWMATTSELPRDRIQACESIIRSVRHMAMGD